MGLKIFNQHNPSKPAYEKLMEHLIDYCDKNPIDYLDDTEYLEKIESEVNNYVNLYAICDDTNINMLM